MYEDILVEEPEPGITLLTLNRPDRMNAIRFQTHDELGDLLTSLDTRALVITGAGRGFCAGDDVVDIFGEGVESPDLGDDPDPEPTSGLLLSRDYPIIAAVNGAAVGYGMGLALMADLRIAGASARFSEMYVKRGLVADVTGFTRLHQLVGRERATWMLLTGELIGAEQAAEWGLVLEVVPDAELVDRALGLARTLAALPPLALAQTKEGLRRVADPEGDAFPRWLASQHAALFRTDDHRESVRAYLEKRPAAYRGA